LVATCLAVGALCCGHRVTEIVPIAHAPESDDFALQYVNELVSKPMDTPFERGHLSSPDGTMTLDLVSDLGLMGAPNGYNGVDLIHGSTGDRQPILSFWDADIGSGYILDARWSSDSKAIRLRGKTAGFRRNSREFRNFDLLYLVNRARYLDLCGSCLPK